MAWPLKFLFTKILPKNKKSVLALFFLLIVIGIFTAWPTLAGESNQASLVTRFLAWIIEKIVSFLGGVLLLEVKILIRIAQYNSFIKSTAVTNGWVIIRDLCNMFFIVVLLIIAIATILKVEMYHYKKLLGRLVIMAVLINFSKMICGLIIDFAQILMMTFVNGFSAAAGGNFVQALKLDKIMQIQPGEEVSDSKILGAYFLALVMTIVSCITVGVMIIVFLMRVMMLWILIVLSPLAFFLSTFPQGQKYAGQWWSQFGNYVVVGPVMAFFLWLSLLSVSSPSPSDLPPKTKGEEDVESRVAISKVAGEEEMIGFAIAIGMLVGGLIITQQMGVMGSSLAGGAVGWMQKKSMAALKGTAKLPLRAVGFAGAKFYEKTGIELRYSKRKEARAERKGAVAAQREARGMARAAERAAGGRTFLGAVGDPRLAKTMTMWEMAKLAIGRPQAKEKMQRSVKRQRAAAASKMRAVDPYQGEILDQESQAAIESKKAERIEKQAEKERKKIDKEEENAKEAEKRITGLQDKKAEIEREIEPIKSAIVLEPEIVGIDEQIKEIEERFRELEAERKEKTTTPERKTAIDKELEGLDEKRKSLNERKDQTIEKRLTEKNPKLASRFSKVKIDLNEAVKSKQEIEGRINTSFGKVELIMKEAASHRAKAEEAKAFLKMPYEEQLKVALEKAQKTGQAALMKKMGEAVAGGEITVEQSAELMSLLKQKMDPEDISKELSKMLSEAEKSKK